jgi:hypothetical protein
MTTTTTTFAAKAGEAYDWLETATRDDGESYVRTKDDAPEWVTRLVHEAHGDFLPDDWRYECVRAALGFIHDNDYGEAEAEDYSSDFADEQVDTYNAARLKWLESNLNRHGYVNEAVEELGYPSDEGILHAIGMGQYLEGREVFDSVVASLRELVEEDDEA